MLKAVYLFFISTLRTRAFLIWMVLFPALLMVIFGALYAGEGGEAQKPPVFLYANGTLKEALEIALNSTFDLKIVDKVGSPDLFVLNATASLRIPATLVVANGSVVEIYSASGIWGPLVMSTVAGVLYSFYYPNVQLPVNVSLKIVDGVANATSLLAQSPTTVAIVLTLVEAMGAGITGVLGVLGSLVVTGLNKKAALSKIGKARLALTATGSALLSSFIGTSAILTAAYMVYKVDPAVILAKWQWWASYLLNFAFFAGIALLVTNALVMGKVEAGSVMSVGVMLYLVFAFTTGYFIPIEVMPKAMADFALSMPTSYTFTFAKVAALGGQAPLSLLYYPAAAATAALLFGLYFFKPYSRP